MCYQKYISSPIGIRLASMGYCISQFLGEVADPTHYSQISRAKIVLWWVAGPATSSLFFFRIRAVYNNSTRITIAFAILWLCILLSPLATVFDTPQPGKISRFPSFSCSKLIDSCPANRNRARAMGRTVSISRNGLLLSAVSGHTFGWLEGSYICA